MSRFYKKLKCLKHIVLAVLFTAGAVLPLREVYAVNPQDTVTVVISSNARWVNTGLTVNIGDRILITATGSWTPGSGFGTWGPNGSTQLWPDNFLNLADIGVCAFCAKTLTPHFAGLIGYIGESPPPPGSYTKASVLTEAKKVFFVGSNYTANVQLAGTLWLNFNDDAYSNFTIDNIGQVTAQITVQAADTPTTPAPFLDLPWDYEGKGLSFNEAALSINSYFDHEYPLLSSGLAEPVGLSDSVINFQSPDRKDINYSSHDGYDYSRLAKVNIGDPVLAAASGIAAYVSSCSDCGNMIIIDHGNGYQTRYLHLQETDLITKSPGEKVQVNTRQQIGRVGATGRVFPDDNRGAHIHFGVFEDKNKDGNFEDNVPDGATDPFGWQSKEKDPWETYTFFYNGKNRTGNRSYYLWKKKIDKLDATLTSNGGVFNTGRYKVDFPRDATNQNLTLNLQSSPIVAVTVNNLRSIGSTVVITASDILGNVVTTFKNLFTLTVDFSFFDLSKYNTNTLSLYSSSNGIDWTKEPTIIDLVNKKATAQVDHLTHFALMAERKDTIPPTTNATLSGEQGQPNWFKSDAVVTLTAEDNTDGLGVDYTLYRIENGENTTDWETYTIPPTFTTEGNHKIEFYSVDKDENVESVKSIEFDIDKTPPEVKIDANLNIIWPPNGKMIDVSITGFATDLHLFSKSLTVEDEYNQINPTLSDFNQTIQLEARRDGSDLDGRTYAIKAIAEDLAGNKTEQRMQVIVPHDQRDKK